MPTIRAYTLLSGAFVFYLFANQTQVGWLYVVAALLAGTVLAAWWLNRSALRGLTVERTINQASMAEVYEEDPMRVEYKIQKTGAGTTHLLLNSETPIADPAGPYRNLALFVPNLPAKRVVALEFSCNAYKRGFYE